MNLMAAGRAAGLQTAGFRRINGSSRNLIITLGRGDKILKAARRPAFVDSPLPMRTGLFIGASNSKQLRRQRRLRLYVYIGRDSFLFKRLRSCSDYVRFASRLQNGQDFLYLNDARVSTLSTVTV